MATALELLSEAHKKGLRADHMRFRADTDLIQIEDVVLRQGEQIRKGLRLLNLRKNRAEKLTRRIHLFFCALAAARIHRPDGWLSVHEIGRIEGWSGGGSVAKLLINELELGSGTQGILEQKGRGAEAELRLRMPPRLVEIGDLPAGVLTLFTQERRTTAAPPAEDVLPRSLEQWDFATQVAGALRASDRVLRVRPLYQGGGREVGNRSLVFGGLEIRSLGAVPGRPAATAVLVKLPVGLNAGKALTVHQDTLDGELQLLVERVAWPGLPARVESVDVELRFDLSVLDELQSKHRIQVNSKSTAMKAIVIPMGHPRTVEAEPCLLRTVIDGMTPSKRVIDGMTPSKRRLTRRDIHNVVIVAERLAALTRLLHRERRAHRHLSVDAVVLRYELGIIDDVLAADLAASVPVPGAADELLFRDLYDLGRVLLHMITGLGLSEVPQDFDLQSGETVARLQFAVSRYLLEASAEGSVATVGLLDQFLYEIQHINMLHWSKARGVPERPVPSSARRGPSDAGWPRSAADPVATRLVTISHLVDVPTLRSWCDLYIESYSWGAWREGVHRSSATADASAAVPSAERCIEILRQGFGRSAASEMWTYLWNAGPDELVRDWVRVLRNYATHWIRERRFDVPHALGEGQESDGLRCELARLRDKIVGWNPRAPDRSALRDEFDELGNKVGAASNQPALKAWIDELDRRTWYVDEVGHPPPGTAEPGRSDPATVTDSRLRSWMQAGVLMRLLRNNAPPTENEIHDVEVSLRGQNAPETVFWHILSARVWVSAAARGLKIGGNEPGWDKAMRALLVAAGVAASRKLPFEMAGTLSASAYLTRLALAIPPRALDHPGDELRAMVLSHGADEDSVRVQAAECALLAADTYLWLDCQNRHCRSILEAVQLLMDCAFPERLIQALQLLSLARNNRVLDWRPPEIPDDPGDPTREKFERYRSDVTGLKAERFTKLEQTLFDRIHEAWSRARGRMPASDDPGTVAAHGYFSRYVPRVEDILEVSGPQLEFDGAAVLDLVSKHYREPGVHHILDLGCGNGDRARRLATTGRYQVVAVDSPLWFTAVGGGSPAAVDLARGLEFIERDPIEYAESALQEQFDVVLFHGSLSRVSRRNRLLSAAYQLLKPGGLVVGADWVQTRTTDRITWSRLLSTLRFVDLDTERGYERLCVEAGFGEFESWSDTAAETEVARSARGHSPGKEGAPRQEVAALDGSPVQRFLRHRLNDTAAKLDGERSGSQRSSYERAFLLRYKRHLETLLAMTTPSGPLGWSWWAARRPRPGTSDDAAARETD